MNCNISNQCMKLREFEFSDTCFREALELSEYNDKNDKFIIHNMQFSLLIYQFVLLQHNVKILML